MFRFGGGLEVCFILAVQLACGLEKVQLEAVGTGTGAPSEAEPQPLLPGELADAASGAGPLGASSEPGVGNLGVGSSFDGLLPGPSGAAAGCKKVDFLFVIDNSFSMEFAQDNLQNSFNGFLEVLGERLETNDFHIMVVDTDGADDEGKERGEAEEGAAGAAAPDICGSVLGAGRRLGGETGTDCQLPPDQRFISGSQPDLDATFRCLAEVGTEGDAREQQMGALLGAVSVGLNEPGGCNANFLRRDAILVITVITNQDDTVTERTPEEWYAELRARKDGQDESIVLLGFFPGYPFDQSSSGFVCNVLAAVNRASRLEDFVSRFPHNGVVSVCEADYGPPFAQAVDSIDLACDRFVSPIQ